jgi:hypothetical protein
MTLTRRNSLALFALLASALLAAEAWIAGFIRSAQDPAIFAIAITADVALGIPLLYYLLLARKRYLPASGMIALYLLALAAVRFVLLPSQQTHLSTIEAFALLGEVAVLGVALAKARDIVRRVRAARAVELYFADALRQGVRQALGGSPVAALLATELSLIYFAGFGWFTRFRTDRPGSVAFPYHRRSGFATILFAMLFIVLVEGGALHLLLSVWNASVAWIVTALNLYALLWMLGFFHAVRLQPIVLDRTHLHLRTGFQWRAEIPLANIAEVRRVTSADKRAAGYLNVAAFGEPRLVLRLREPVTIAGLFGRARGASVIGITVDDEKELVAELNQRIGP